MVSLFAMSISASAPKPLFKNQQFLTIWIVGILVSIVRWLEFLAVGIFAYDATSSAFLVAILALLRFLPLALFGSIIGALSDLMDSSRLLRFGLTMAGFFSFIMTCLFVANLANYWHVAVAVFLSGMFWASDQPLRRKLIGEIAGIERVAQAMATDTATSNGTRVIGPLIGGLVYQWIGCVGVFFISTVFYGLALFLMLRFQGPATTASVGTRINIASPLVGAWQAILYALNNREISCILGITVIYNIWGFPMLSMVPVIGKEELGLEPGMVGAISALEGGCALVGSLLVARFIQPKHYRKLSFFGVCALLIIIFTMGILPGFITLILGLVGAGFAGAGFSTMQSTLAYLVAPPEMRGRLLGLITICIGSGLIGFANIGLMADLYGASTALIIVAIEGIIPMIMIGIAWRELRSTVPPSV